MDLVERNSPLAELERLAREAVPGAGAVALIGSEAGQCKTSVATALRDRCHSGCVCSGAGATRCPPLDPPWDLAAEERTLLTALTGDDRHYLSEGAL